jgi:hypothetical protein
MWRANGAGVPVVLRCGAEVLMVLGCRAEGAAQKLRKRGNVQRAGRAYAMLRFEARD